jgi:TolB protein
MADPRPDDEAQPWPDGGGDHARRRLRNAVALALVVSIVALATLEGGGLLRVQGEVPASPSAGRIAVVDANGALVSMDGRGGSLVSYVAPGVAFQFPAWSPDGSRIAAIGRDADGVGIYIFPAGTEGADGTGPDVIYRSPDRPPFYLYWTPDGRQLTFLTTEPDGIGLRIAPADGSTPATTIRRGAPLYWDWVDPARLMLHLGGSGPGAFVGEVGLDGVSFESAVLESGQFRSPGVTHDLRYRAYGAPAAGAAATAGAAGEIVIEARDRSRSLEIPVFGVAAMGFDPIGDSLAFIAPDVPTGPSSALAVGPLRLVDAGSGSVRTLLDGSVVAFFWAPDGRTIAALRLEAPTDDNVVTAVNAVVSVPAGAARSPVASTAQGEGILLRLVFVDVAAGTLRSSRVVRLSDPFASQVLPFFDQYALSHRLWSPDGASVALPLVGEHGSSQLVIVPADGSDARHIATGAIGFWSP